MKSQHGYIIKLRSTAYEGIYIIFYRLKEFFRPVGSAP